MTHLAEPYIAASKVKKRYLSGKNSQALDNAALRSAVSELDAAGGGEIILDGTFYLDSTGQPYNNILGSSYDHLTTGEEFNNIVIRGSRRGNCLLRLGGNLRFGKAPNTQHNDQYFGFEDHVKTRYSTSYELISPTSDEVYIDFGASGAHEFWVADTVPVSVGDWVTVWAYNNVVDDWPTHWPQVHHATLGGFQYPAQFVRVSAIEHDTGNDIYKIQTYHALSWHYKHLDYSGRLQKPRMAIVTDHLLHNNGLFDVDIEVLSGSVSLGFNGQAGLRMGGITLIASPKGSGNANRMGWGRCVDLEVDEVDLGTCTPGVDNYYGFITGDGVDQRFYNLNAWNYRHQWNTGSSGIGPYWRSGLDVLVGDKFTTLGGGFEGRCLVAHNTSDQSFVAGTYWEEDGSASARGCGPHKVRIKRSTFGVNDNVSRGTASGFDTHPEGYDVICDDCDIVIDTVGTGLCCNVRNRGTTIQNCRLFQRAREFVFSTGTCESKFFNNVVKYAQRILNNDDGTKGVNDVHVKGNTFHSMGSSHNYQIAINGDDWLIENNLFLDSVNTLWNTWSIFEYVKGDNCRVVNNYIESHVDNRSTPILAINPNADRSQLEFVGNTIGKADRHTDLVLVHDMSDGDPAAERDFCANNIITPASSTIQTVANDTQNAKSDMIRLDASAGDAVLYLPNLQPLLDQPRFEGGTKGNWEYGNNDPDYNNETGMSFNEYATGEWELTWTDATARLYQPDIFHAGDVGETFTFSGNWTRTSGTGKLYVYLGGTGIGNSPDERRVYSGTVGGSSSDFLLDISGTDFAGAMRFASLMMPTRFRRYKIKCVDYGGGVNNCAVRTRAPAYIPGSNETSTIDGATEFVFSADGESIEIAVDEVNKTYLIV